MIKLLKNLRCRLLLAFKSNIHLGKGSTFGRGTVFYAPNEMKIDRNVYIGKYCSLETDLEIGTGCVIGNNVGMIGKYDHDYTCIGKRIKDAPWVGDSDYQFRGKGLKTVIGSDVWVGYGSVILGGVNIGSGAIVAAGSVVVKNVQPYTIVAGNPAVEIGERFSKEEIIEHEKQLEANGQ